MTDHERERLEILEKKVFVLEDLLSRRGQPKSRGGKAMNPDELEEVFDVSMNKTEAANALGVTRATIYNMLADGRLKATASGRVLTKSVTEYIRNRDGQIPA